jgi:hypothetical protein
MEDPSQQRPTRGPSSPPDKLRDGPCSEAFGVLEECRRSRGIDERNGRAAMALCVSETDRLLACVHRHPAYFHEKRR